MKNISIDLCVLTTRSLATSEAVDAIYQALVDDEQLQPSLIGFVEPLREKFDAGTARKRLEALHGPDGDCCMLRYQKADLRGSMTLWTDLSVNSGSHGLHAKFDYIHGHGRLSSLVELLKRLIRPCKADFAAMSLVGGDPFFVHMDDPQKNLGEVHGMLVPPAAPTGIKLLNGVWWINVFGRKYIDFFGEAVLRSAIAHEAHSFEDSDTFWLQTMERPEEMFTAGGMAAADAIRRHLGHPRAFLGHDPTLPSFLATYDSPAFDFSEIRRAR